MKGDFSRITGPNARAQHYNGVLKQQGRVQLDADWNEFNSITAYQRQIRTHDIIGCCGAPKYYDGFEIIPLNDGTGDFLISTGRFYIDGILCESDWIEPLSVRDLVEENRLEFREGGLSRRGVVKGSWVKIVNTLTGESQVTQVEKVLERYKRVTFMDKVGALCRRGKVIIKPLIRYSSQNFLTEEQRKLLSKGPEFQHVLYYLEVWERHITALEDSMLREVALGGPDTDTRTQVVAQVRALPLENPARCEDAIKEWDELIAKRTGRLTTILNPDQPAAGVCSLGESGGYQGLENRLYRVEVHDGGQLDGGASFKWSRGNAAQAYAIESFANNSDVVLNQRGKDDILQIKIGDLVEIIDELTVLNPTARGVLAEVIDIQGLNVTLDQDVSSLDRGRIPLLRRWDFGGDTMAEATAITTDEFELEDGISIQFLGETFRSGDHWMFAARTITGEIEQLDQAAPHGIERHYCRLGIGRWNEKGLLEVEDCRPIFPPLTELDQPEDLALHNKLLHGMGVVCGLKVKCGTTASRNTVVVEPGYAIDCDGRMIHQVQPQGISVPVIEAAEKYLREGFGEVCLTIERSSTGRAIIGVEPYEKKSFWDDVLEGTLLRDFVDKCLLNLVKFFEDQFGFGDTAPLKDQDKRTTVALNMLLQLARQESGRRMFLSGGMTRDCSAENTNKTEDELLWCLYRDLQELIGGETFCGIFDYDRPFPKYELDEGMDTVFGPPLRRHTEFHIHPEKRFGYTCGFENKVYAYDLLGEGYSQGEAVPNTSPSTNTVKDVALTVKGDGLLALVDGNAQGSMIARAAVENDGRLSWKDSFITPSHTFDRIFIASNGRLFGLKKGQGLFIIMANNNMGQVRPVVDNENFTGLTLLDERQDMLFVAVAEKDVSVSDKMSFERILRISLIDGDEPRKYFFSGDELAEDMHVYGGRLYITGTIESNRFIGCFEINSSRLLSSTPLPVTGPVRLGSFEGERGIPYLLLTLVEENRIVRWDLENEALDQGFSIPTQFIPGRTTVDRKNQVAYVHNSGLNTFTRMQMDRVFAVEGAPDYTAPTPINLINYRDDVMDAYEDLLAHFLQYLKDCFCDQFLIDCPSCDGEEKIYLGCVEIRNGRVYKICNFTKRKYVKSFRTVDYWRSAIPLQALFTKGFNLFCCWIINRRRAAKYDFKGEYYVKENRTVNP